MMAGTARSCRKCGGAFDRGFVWIHGTPLGRILIGWSYTKLFFEPDGASTGEVPIVPWYRKMVTYRCLGCGDLVITRHEWSDQKR
jgi:hypothetical protein